MPRPPQPRIYHITPVAYLPSIVADGELCSDARMIARRGANAGIGISRIKERRLALPVKCHPGDHVGEYVPFYFCPRSVMLYVIFRGNNPDLTYRGGQDPIIHFEADLEAVVGWAEAEGRRWAFSLSNAGANYAQFRRHLDQLDEINWDAVRSTDFSSSDVKEGKQAEFLVRDGFPLRLVRRIGVRSLQMLEKVEALLPAGPDRPLIEVRREWYY